MPTLSKDVALNIIGQIAEYQAAAAQIPGVSEKAAAQAALKMQAVFVKQANQQVQLAQQTANKVVQVQNAASNKVAEGFSASFQRAAKGIQQNQLISQVETVGSLFIQLGGNVSRMASIFTSAVRPIAIMNAVMGESAASMALVAGAAVAGAVAIGGLIYVFSGLGSSAAEAAKELEGLGVGIDQQAREQIDAYASGAQALTIELDKLKVALGSDMAEHVGAVKLGLAAFFSEVDKGVQNLKAFEAEVRGGITVLGEFAHLAGVSEGVIRGLALGYQILNAAVNPFGTVAKQLTQSFQDQNRAIADAKERSKEFDREMVQMGIATEQANKALEDQVKKDKEKAKSGQDSTTQIKNQIEAQKDLEQSIRAITAALERGHNEYEQFNKFYDGMIQDQLSSEDKIRLKTDERFQHIADLEAKGVITAEDAGAARTAAMYSENQDLQEIENARLKADGEAEVAFYDRQKALRDKRKQYEIQASEEIAAAYIDAAQSVLDAWTAADAARVSDTESTLSDVQSKEKALTAKIKQETDYRRRNIEKYNLQVLKEQEKGANTKLALDKKLARESAIAARAVSVFSIGLSTAEAVAKAIAEWGPPPSPPGILGIASALAVGGAQLTAVLAQPLPTFYQGTGRVPNGPGEVAATLHGGEAILNSRTTRDLGPAIIDALNAGLSPLAAMGGGPGDVYLDGDSVGRVMARQARGAGAFGEAVRASGAAVGFRNPYGRY